MWGLLLFLWLGLGGPGLLAQEPAARFDAANRLYEQGQFPAAIQAYQELLAGGGASAALHFNLGNAHFRAGQRGRAIYHYRLAQRMAPRDAEVRRNLTWVRNAVGGQAGDYRPPALAWSGFASPNQWAGAALVLGWALGAWLIAGRRPGRPGRGRKLAWALGTMWCIAFAGLLAQRHEYRQAQGVITAEEAVLRYGPLEESPAAFTLPDGAEVRIWDAKGDWLQVGSGARRGWVRTGQLVLLPNS